MNSQYQVFDIVLGKGSFGIVKLGLDNSTGKLVAIKTELKSNDKCVLRHENSIIKHTKGKDVMNSLCFWEDKFTYYLALDLMGPSIDSFHKLYSRRFSLKTTLMLSLQMLDAIKYYHSLNVLHRDIKPSNFLVSFSLPHTTIYLVDFGLAKKIVKETVPAVAKQVGSLRYMSKYIHNSEEATYRDDLYSLGYSIIYMLTGVLPWHDNGHMEKNERKKHIGNLKWKITNDVLVNGCKCKDCTSCTFRNVMREYFDYLDSCNSLKIDYTSLKHRFIQCMNNHGYVNDHIWDWTREYMKK